MVFWLIHFLEADAKNPETMKDKEINDQYAALFLQIEKVKGFLLFS